MKQVRQERNAGIAEPPAAVDNLGDLDEGLDPGAASAVVEAPPAPQEEDRGAFAAPGMTVAYVGIGANLGDPPSAIRAAVQLLAAGGLAGLVARRSAVAARRRSAEVPLDLPEWMGGGTVTVVNEPVLSYAPGSPERAELKRRLGEIATERVHIRQALSRVLAAPTAQGCEARIAAARTSRRIVPEPSRLTRCFPAAPRRKRYIPLRMPSSAPSGIGSIISTWRRRLTLFPSRAPPPSRPAPEPPDQSGPIH